MLDTDYENKEKAKQINLISFLNAEYPDWIFMIAMGAFFFILWAYMWVPFLFFWKMKKDIKFDLEVAEDVVRDLEAKEQAGTQGNIS